MLCKRSNGFSLIELMVVIAIVAILVALAFPSFQSSMRSNRVATATNELMASFSLARSEAMRSPGGAVLCTSADGAVCGGDWNDGWIVWVDIDGDLVMDAGDRVVRYVESNPNLALDAAFVAGNPLIIGFDRRARVRNNTPNGLEVGLQPVDCPSGQNLRREFNLMATGQTQITRTDCI